MVSRDKLHDMWHTEGLGWKMTGLVVLGGVISFLLNADALRIAIASSLAFATSEAINAAVYSPMLNRRWPWLLRVNLGNIPNALVDSALFIGIAFGFMPVLILLQALVKILGGWFGLLDFPEY
jgi:queuosine precursor transporter